MDTPRPPRRRAAVLAASAGVLAGALALGVAEVLAALVAPTSAPVLAVGSAFIDLTPAWLKDLAIDLFGTNDKVALLAGIGVVITLLAAAAGVLSLRRRWLGSTLVVLLGVVAAVAATSRPDAGKLAVVPSLLGVAAGAVALKAMVDRVGDGAARLGGGTDRRSFLAAAAATGVLAALAGVGGRLLGRATRDVDASREAIMLPQADPPLPRARDSVSADVEGMPPWQTPNPDFYRIDTALRVPRLATDDWRLRVHGMVEREVEIGFDDLLAGQMLEQWVTLACVSNEVGGDLAGNARWLGCPLSELLERAGPLPGADMVLSTSDDGFTASTPLQSLTDDRGSMLAIGMNGEPLPLEHGFPVRMVVPGLYGYVSATKWVVDLEVTTFARQTAYWTDRGWDERGPIKIASRIDVPRPFATRPPGMVAIGGTAWAPRRGIDTVEVKVDDGAWQPAKLAAEADIDAWRQWSFVWDATPGRHAVTVRATDGDGQVQTSDAAPPFPDGASGWHSIEVNVA
ncbi:MAG TPA: molybdopterin-dependent oxidoreductase [Actinomycetales bacterium]|nr:molybdopterin-dependent oxidoreductase [Actinomycetales bacterium]